MGSTRAVLLKLQDSFNMKLDFIFPMFQQLYIIIFYLGTIKRSQVQLNCALADIDVVTQCPFKHLELNMLH